jgi:hypothetical protein
MSERIGSRFAKAGIVLAMLMVTLGVAASGAQATLSHPFLGTFDGSETPSGAFEPSTGVAVDGAGYLYVANLGAAAVDVYNPDHEFVTAIPTGYAFGNTPLAVDTEGNVYIIDVERESSVVLFEPDQYPPNLSTTYSSSVVYHPTGGGYCDRRCR